MFFSIYFIVAFFFVLGALVGSFLNVVVYRLPIILKNQLYRNISEIILETRAKDELTGIAAIDQSGVTPDQWEIKEHTEESSFLFLAWPRSSCPNCGHQIKAYENIPILSWLFLRAKCSGCQKPISGQYPLVELLTAVLTAGVAYRYGYTVQALCYSLLVWIVISLTLIDFKHYSLPDIITLPGIWLGLILSYQGIIDVEFSYSFYGVIVGYLLFWIVNTIFRILYKKDGMGYGDFKLLAMLGAWFGLPNIMLIVLIASCLGAVIGIVLITQFEWHKEKPIPFGPYLVVGGIVVLFWGGAIQQFLGLDILF